MGFHRCGCSYTQPSDQCSLCNPGTTATEAGTRKNEKHRELLDNGNVFQPVALEVQGSLGESRRNLLHTAYFLKLNIIGALKKFSTGRLGKFESSRCTCGNPEDALRHFFLLPTL